MTTVYIVMASEGCYSETTVWPEAVFNTEAEAEAHSSHLRANAVVSRDPRDRIYDRRYEVVEAPFNPFAGAK